MKSKLFYLLLAKNSSENKTELESETIPYTFKSNGHRLRNYRIYGNSVERKNLLKNTAVSQTITGVTFTVNDDGSVTCNGTAVGIYNTFYIPFNASGGTYILNGCPKSGSDNSYRLDIRDSSGNVIAFDYGEGTGGVQLGDSAAYRITIRLQQNYICDNLTFYPMIRKANIEDSTYEPYIENTSVGDLQANGKYLVPVTVSGKNLAPTILPQSSGGINIQQIGDGIYSMSGTSQKQNNFVFTSNLSLPMGDYKIVNMGTVRIALDFKNISGATVFKSTNPGEAVSFSYPGNAQREINIYVPLLSNNTVDGTVKYMIIRASEEYNSYEPYHEPQTVNIYLDEQLNENDYIDFRKQKRYPSGDMISLPAIPTIDGTNILSVATETQPSKIYLQGNITEIETVSAQALQANIQSLQPLSLDDENLELDVMPIDKSEIQTDYISETPVENTDESETENLETTGGVENAE